MIYLASIGLGGVVGWATGYTIDYGLGIDSREGLIHSISGFVISTLGLIWGGYLAGAGLAGGITATLLTKEFPQEFNGKLLIRISTILLFSAISSAFIGIF